MHTWASDRDKNGDETRIHFNSDFSGNAVVTRVSDQSIKLGELSVPAEHLLQFVAEYIRGQRISILEQADWKQFVDFS